MPRTSKKAKQTLRERIAEIDEEILFADGFEDALLGTVVQFNRGPVALYDWDKCVKILMNRDDMTYEEAVEWMDFNVTGAWLGEQTPAFAHLVTEDDA